MNSIDVTCLDGSHISISVSLTGIEPLLHMKENVWLNDAVQDVTVAVVVVVERGGYVVIHKEIVEGGIGDGESCCLRWAYLKQELKHEWDGKGEGEAGRSVNVDGKWCLWEQVCLLVVRSVEVIELASHRLVEILCCRMFCS